MHTNVNFNEIYTSLIDNKYVNHLNNTNLETIKKKMQLEIAVRGKIDIPIKHIHDPHFIDWYKHLNKE